MIKIFRKIKWIIIAVVITATVFLLIGFMMSGSISSTLIWPICIFGIVALAGLIFLKIHNYSIQPESEFTITVSSIFKSPVIPFLSRYVLKYKITIEDQKKKIERIVIKNNKIIKVSHRDTNLPFQYLEQILENDIISVEKMIREMYPRCKIIQPVLIK